MHGMQPNLPIVKLDRNIQADAMSFLNRNNNMRSNRCNPVSGRRAIRSNSIAATNLFNIVTPGGGNDLNIREAGHDFFDRIPRSNRVNLGASTSGNNFAEIINGIANLNIGAQTKANVDDVEYTDIEYLNSSSDDNDTTIPVELANEQNTSDADNVGSIDEFEFDAADAIVSPTFIEQNTNDAIYVDFMNEFGYDFESLFEFDATDDTVSPISIEPNTIDANNLGFNDGFGFDIEFDAADATVSPISIELNTNDATYVDFMSEFGYDIESLFEFDAADATVSPIIIEPNTIDADKLGFDDAADAAEFDAADATVSPFSIELNDNVDNGVDQTIDPNESNAFGWFPCDDDEDDDDDDSEQPIEVVKPIEKPNPPQLFNDFQPFDRLPNVPFSLSGRPRAMSLDVNLDDVSLDDEFVNLLQRRKRLPRRPRRHSILAIPSMDTIEEENGDGMNFL